MEQIAEQITQDFLHKLPDQAQFFTPGELLSAGIPGVVVETLRKNAVSMIQSELQMPESEWVESDQEIVQAAWQDFVEISGQHARFPVSKLSNLLAEAVEQCLELALKPRQSVAEIIFRTRDTIGYETMKERVDSLLVNRQLGQVLLRYMEKKEKKEITKEHARELIKKVDQRLVENYHSLNWARVLRPVFDVAGPSVGSGLFRIFFEDKDRPAYARKFSQLDKEFTEKEFIEFLSSADMLDIEEDEEDQPEWVAPAQEDAETEKTVEIGETSAEDEKEGTTSDKAVDESVDKDEETTVEVKTELDEPQAEESAEPVQVEKEELVDEETDNIDEHEEKAKEPDDREENILNRFSQIKDVELLDEDQDKPVISLIEEGDSDEEDNITLLNKFIFDESKENPAEKVSEEPGTPERSEEKEPSSIYEEMNLVKDDGIDIENNRDIFEESPVENRGEEEDLSFKIERKDEEPIEAGQVNEDSDDEGETPPMWRSFLERDDLETDSGYEYEEGAEVEQSDEFTEDGFIEEPIYDLTTDESDPEEKISKISEWLEDEKGRFVDEIFKGSEIAYEQALIEMLDFEDWKAASMYLERDIFSRNKVDVYDEAAVDFTDRLHSYFLENDSKQNE